MLEPVSITLRVSHVLEELEVPYFIGGSFASTLYGMVRTTQDCDIITLLEEDQIAAFVEALQSDFYIDEISILDAIQHRSSFNLIHRDSMFKVDIFIPPLRAYTKVQFARAKREILSIESEEKTMVASAEDILLAKLEWFRLGGEVSERQWRDVLGILKVQSQSLDEEYLFKMAKELEIDDLFEKAIKEVNQ